MARGLPPLSPINNPSTGDDVSVAASRRLRRNHHFPKPHGITAIAPFFRTPLSVSLRLWPAGKSASLPRASTSNRSRVAICRPASTSSVSPDRWLATSEVGSAVYDRDHSLSGPFRTAWCSRRNEWSSAGSVSHRQPMPFDRPIRCAAARKLTRALSRNPAGSKHRCRWTCASSRIVWDGLRFPLAFWVCRVVPCASSAPDRRGTGPAGRLCWI